jgi:Alpha-L-arabinofuranosidase B (ABFB) domain
MSRAMFKTIISPIRRIAAWVACLAVLMLPGTGFVQEPTYRSLLAFSPRDYYIRHAGFVGQIGQAKTDLDVRDAKFRIVPGLADRNCVSFESTNVRDHYLKHAFFRIVLAKRLDEQKYREDATFCTVPGLHKTNRSGAASMSFRSFNFPDRYIRHRNFELWLDPLETTPLFRDDATFFMVQPATREMSFEGDTVPVPTGV